MNYIPELMFTLINAMILVGNLCLLHTFIKLYSEVLKSHLIKGIGK